MIRTVMFVAGLGLLGYWYVAQNPNKVPSPDTDSKVPVVSVDGVQLIFDSQVEKFPEAPQEAVQKLLEPLSGLFVGRPNDALEMARATQHFARNVRNNPKLDNLTQYSKVEKDGLEGLFKGSLPLQGTYDGRISPVSKAVYNYFLSPLLKDNEGNVTTVKLDTTSRQALGSYLDAMSWKFSQEYIKEVAKTPKEEK